MLAAKNCLSSNFSSQNEYMNEIQEMPDDVLLELIARFGQTIMRARDDLEK